MKSKKSKKSVKAKQAKKARKENQNKRIQYPLYKINGTNNALDCGLFNGLPFGTPCISFHVDDTNTPILLASIPDVTDDDVRAFMEKPFKFYRLPIASNNAFLMLIRGAIDIDVSFENIYGANDVDRFCECYLIDCNTAQIRGVRFISLEENLQAEIRKTLMQASASTLSKIEIAIAAKKMIAAFSPQQLKERAEYIGKATGRITAENFYTF